jgi:hypothetical protein
MPFVPPTGNIKQEEVLKRLSTGLAYMRSAAFPVLRSTINSRRIAKGQQSALSPRIQRVSDRGMHPSGGRGGGSGN